MQSSTASTAKARGTRRAPKKVIRTPAGAVTQYVVRLDRGLANLRRSLTLTEINGWHIDYVNISAVPRTHCEESVPAGKMRRGRAIERPDRREGYRRSGQDFEPVSAMLRKKRLSVIRRKPTLHHDTDVTYPRPVPRDAAAG